MSGTLSRRTLLSAAALGASCAVRAPLALAATAQPFFKRIRQSLGLELYTVAKEMAADLDGTLARVAAIGYRHVEVSGYYGSTAKELRAACDRNGLVCRSLHAQPQPVRAAGDATFTDMPRLIDEAKTLGVQHVVLPIPPLRLDFHSNSLTMNSFMDAVRALTVDDWKACAALLNDRGEQLARAGLKIAYHNHNMEFKPMGGTTPYEILMKETHPSIVSFEVDVGWVASAGLDPIELMHRHRGRFQLMHVKDQKSSTMTNYTIQTDPADIGAGMLNWTKLLPAAYDAGVRNFMVEQEPPYPAGAMTSVENGYRFLSQLKA
jgi:sugar phosphate isomerase/epimerase